MSETKFRLKIGIIGGTGIDQDSSIIKDKKLLDIKTTPYGSASDSQVISGTIEGVEVFIMGRHGSKHEVNPSDVNYRANLWSLKELGCTHVLVTTACGSLKQDITPGDFAILDQYIDRTIGRSRSFYKVSHIPQNKPFDQKLQQILIDSCVELNYKYHPKVTAVTIEGPRFSTLAESRLHQSWGCDIVNMTTVPEAQLAAELGLIYASLALVTDYDVWHESDDECVSVELVTNRLKQLAQRAKNVLVLAVKKVSQTDWTQVWTEKQNTAKSAIMTE
jgi:5'-methylthioadenosine phosphorylase